VLHAVVSSVHNARRRRDAAVTESVFDVSDSVVSFNNAPGHFSSCTFQIHLLRLVLSVMGLEHQLIASRIESLQVCRCCKCDLTRSEVEMAMLYAALLGSTRVFSN